MRSFVVRLAIVFLLSFFCFSAYSQEVALGEAETLTLKVRQWDCFASIHTNGIGIGGRIEKIKSIKLQHGFDFEWTYYRQFKEQRISLGEANSLIYGKKNYFTLLRGGYGFTKILNTRPYSGGVEVGWFFYGGVSLGFSIPVYVNVYEIKNNQLYTKMEKYDTTIFLSNIESRAPFYKGVKNLKIHPGIYAKTGLSFDFSSNDNLVVKLDIGIAFDAYLFPVEKMTYTSKQYLLCTGYIALHFGKRKSIHDL